MLTGMFFLLDGTIMLTNNIDWNFNKIEGLKDPTENLDAINKQYLDLML